MQPNLELNLFSGGYNNFWDNILWFNDFSALEKIKCGIRLQIIRQE